MLIRNCDIEGKTCDVRIANDAIAAVELQLTEVGSEPVIDAKGGALLPGLHDHHIHLTAAAAAINSVQCGPPHVFNEDDLRGALHGLTETEWVRGVGYHQSVAGDITRDWLDVNGPDKPVRIQHRSGRLWILNTRAMRELGIREPADGRLYDRDDFVKCAMQASPPVLKGIVEKLISAGVTGATDTTPGNDTEDLERLVKEASPLRLCVMGTSKLESVKGAAAASVGPVKFHYHDNDLPPLARLADEIKRTHAAGRNVAAHCVTDAEIMLFLAAMEEAGVQDGDRIEHAAISDNATIEWIKRLGLIVVTQPNFIVERSAAYKSDVPSQDQCKLWRVRSFIEAGVPLAAGSDAPFGGINPWRGMAAAVTRPKEFSFDEEVTPEQALALYTKPATDAGKAPRKIAVGEQADLCLLTKPWREVRSNLEKAEVRATLIDGVVAYDSMTSTSPHSNAVAAGMRAMDSAI